MSGPAIAYVAAVTALSTVIPERPLPAGINRGQVGDWSITLNASREPIKVDGQPDPLGPWTLFAENSKYFAFAIMDPTGGMTGGISEDEFIADMQRLGGDA